MRSSARAQASRADGQRFERGLGVAVGLAPSRSRRRRARRRRRGGRFRRISISLISARRFSANSAGASSSSARSAVTSVTRASMVAICEAALCLAVLPFGALGGDRLHAAVGQFGLARQRLRFGAHLRGEAAMAVDLAANGGEPAFRSRGSAAARPARRRRSHARLRPRCDRRRDGVWASVSADLRAAWRLISRSVVGMALARGIGLALRGTPGLAGGGLGGGRRLQFGLGVFQRLPLGGGVGAGLLQLVFDIDQARAFGETPRGAGRRMRGGDKTVPAPDVAFQRHQPLAGLQLRHQFRAALLRRRRRSARRRRASSDGASTWAASASTPAGSDGSSKLAPALVQRIGADGSTGASRSSPSTAPIAFS